MVEVLGRGDSISVIYQLPILFSIEVFLQVKTTILSVTECRCLMKGIIGTVMS